MQIGEVARVTGLSIDTLRYYDRAGLLGEVRRDPAGRRTFDSQALGLLDVVQRLRRTQMPVDEVRRFVELVRLGDAHRAGRLELLRVHRDRVHHQRVQLNEDIAVIEWKIAAYEAGEDDREAPPPPPKWPQPTGRLPAADLRTDDHRDDDRLNALSTIGVGTWALGGPFRFNGRDAGWGPADDTESVRALHAAIAAGVTLVDTAPCYGTGHAERVVGRALRELPPGARDRITVATKFGLVIDEASRTGGGTDVSPAAIRAECEVSLRRLGVERLGLYQLHGGAETRSQAEDVIATCLELQTVGKIGAFGSAQDDPATLAAYEGVGAQTVQTQINVFGWNAAVLATARENGWRVLARSPLAMGMLTGKYGPDRRPAAGDVRLDTPWWTYFDADAMPSWLTRLDAVRDLLTVGGRSLVQGALGYVLAVDPAVIPLPGVRTVAQAEENASALALGPLPVATATEITRLLSDSPERS